MLNKNNNDNLGLGLGLRSPVVQQVLLTKPTVQYGDHFSGPFFFFSQWLGVTRADDPPPVPICGLALFVVFYFFAT